MFFSVRDTSWPNGIPRFLKGAGNLCLPIPSLPAAIAVKHLHSRAASRIFTPAAGSASRVAAPTVVPRGRRSAMEGSPRTIATARHLAAEDARSAKCSAPRARVAARRPRSRSSPAVTSLFTAPLASSSAAAGTDLVVVTAGAATEWRVARGGIVDRDATPAQSERGSETRTDAQE